MSAQNIYDDAGFYAGYAKLPRSEHGLTAVYEWPAFQRLLPASLTDLRVLDLGCGFGAFAREARARGARSVLAVDLSERMLEEARARTDDAAITYVRASLEEFEPQPRAFDLAVSTLALHYLPDVRPVFARVAAALVPGGRFSFSVEHPIYTAAGLDWHKDADGKRLFWPVDRYRDEGERRTSWFVDGVVKYHRTIETYVNTLIAAGLVLARLEEPETTEEVLAEHPDWRQDRRRPPFLLIAADSPR
jgi:SAM-dependent methyltransferase